MHCGELRPYKWFGKQIVWIIDFVNMNIVSNTSKVNSQPKSTKSRAAEQNTEVHQQSKSIPCEHCEQVFKTQKELSSHTRLCHYRDFT